MQPPFSCAPKTYAALESSLSSGRLGRYLGAAHGDKHFALRLYVWNGRLCEAFYLPMQLTEVTVRNSVQKALAAQYGQDWYNRGSFTCTLPTRFKDRLATAIKDAKAKYGMLMNADHIVAEISLGFWVHLLTKPYDKALWPKHYGVAFPHKPNKIRQNDIHGCLERMRLFRNRIAHHGPIFDRSPKAEYQNCMTLVEWICDETKWFTSMIARVDQVINSRPQTIT